MDSNGIITLVKVVFLCILYSNLLLTIFAARSRKFNVLLIYVSSVNFIDLFMLFKYFTLFSACLN